MQVVEESIGDLDAPSDRDRMLRLQGDGSTWPHRDAI